MDSSLHKYHVCICVQITEPVSHCVAGTRGVVQFLQSMDLTSLSDWRGSVHAWMLNEFAHALCFDTVFSLCFFLASSFISGACTQCQYPDESCTSLKKRNKGASLIS